MRRDKSVTAVKESSLDSVPKLPIDFPRDKELEVDIKCFCMSEEMINYAAESAEEALRQCSTRKDVAAFVKKRFDEKYGTLWHCVVGRDFGR